MRLNEFDPNSISVRDRGRGGGFPGGGGGQIGCGMLAILLIGALVFGIDPASMFGGVEQTQQQNLPQSQVPGQTATTAAEACGQGQYRMEACAHLASLNETWTPLFREANIPFQPPTLNFYEGGTNSGCGVAQSAMGPFYCPSDEGIYLDTSFFNALDKGMQAGGDFARAYVIAHEYGHHVQKMTGLADQIRSAQQQNPSRSNQLQVRMELQADCYAGVWAAKNRSRIEPGDIEEGLNAAHQIGDDILMRSAGQRPVEAAFTHGSSAQRMEWLRKGLTTGDEDQCDTFADMR